MRMGAEGSRGVHQVSRQPPTHGRRSRGSDTGGGLSEPGQPLAGGQAAEVAFFAVPVVLPPLLSSLPAALGGSRGHPGALVSRARRRSVCSASSVS